MKLTRERKVYAMLLGIGCLALAADRLMGGPGTALARTGLAAEEPVAGALASVVPERIQVTIRERLSEMMAASGTTDGRDVFQLDAAWRTMLEPEPDAEDEAKLPAAGEITAVSTSGAMPTTEIPRVTMIVRDGAGGLAMIDEKLVKVGETTATGVTLLSVESRAARLLVNGVEVVVEVIDGGDHKSE